MDIDRLYLEVTRMCNLECEHCLRGDEEKEFMSPETIVNTLKGVKKIRKLLITGGEPLLAIRQIRLIVELIKKENIQVDSILLITNSTIMSENVLAVLRELASVSQLFLKLSFDMFHYIELNRLNLLEKRKANAQVFKEEFGAEDYGYFEDGDHRTKELIESKGRALKITEERLEEINSMSKKQYELSDVLGLTHGPLYYYDLEIDEKNNSIYGIVNVDVGGNIVAAGQSFASEDEEHNKYSSNINELGLLEALKNYDAYYEEQQRAMEEKKKLIKYYFV